VAVLPTEGRDVSVLQNIQRSCGVQLFPYSMGTKISSLE